jgi:hypothetical protein
MLAFLTLNRTNPYHTLRQRLIPDIFLRIP